MEKDLPKRKASRLKGFDYSENGAYFLTVCTQNRKKILSAIVGEGSPLPNLSRYGEIVEELIKTIPDKYREITVDYYVIMPNHIRIMRRSINISTKTLCGGDLINCIPKNNIFFVSEE